MDTEQLKQFRQFQELMKKQKEAEVGLISNFKANEKYILSKSFSAMIRHEARDHEPARS